MIFPLARVKVNPPTARAFLCRRGGDAQAVAWPGVEGRAFAAAPRRGAFSAPGVHPNGQPRWRMGGQSRQDTIRTPGAGEFHNIL